MGSLLFLVVLSLCFVSVRGEDIPECGSNFYFSKRTGKCTPCSKCGDNEIIREVCENNKNTICGPFIEFNQFQQSPINNVHPTRNLTYEWEDRMDNIFSLENTNPTNSQVGSPVEISEDKKWYILAMALLGILCVIALFVGIYIFAVCVVCKRQRHDKEIIYDPEECTSVTRNANTRTRLIDTLIPSRTKTKAKRTHYNRSGATPNVYNTVIPVTLEDCDNSGQTESSGSSAHYVYFKTAEPN